MFIFYEDREIERSLPNNLQQLYKHILNCIYEPKLFHVGWLNSIKKQVRQIQAEARKFGTKRVIRILENNVNKSYKNAVDEFMEALNSDSNFSYPYSEMKRIIPKSYKDIGKNTEYEKFKWDVESIVNMNLNVLNEFCSIVQDNSESPYDLYR
jgi:hypothetical protein